MPSASFDSSLVSGSAGHEGRRRLEPVLARARCGVGAELGDLVDRPPREATDPPADRAEGAGDGRAGSRRRAAAVVLAGTLRRLDAVGVVEVGVVLDDRRFRTGAAVGAQPVEVVPDETGVLVVVARVVLRRADVVVDASGCREHGGAPRLTRRRGRDGGQHGLLQGVGGAHRGRATVVRGEGDGVGGRRRHLSPSRSDRGARGDTDSCGTHGRGTPGPAYRHPGLRRQRRRHGRGWRRGRAQGGASRAVARPTTCREGHGATCRA